MLVIGAGPASVAMHLPVLARLRRKRLIELVLICDLDSQRAAAARLKFGFLETSGDGVAALARPDIDAVYIFGSAQLHYEYGLAALRAGKHLFVEKPIAPSYVHACEIAQAAEARGLIAVGGHNRRFSQALAAVRERAGKMSWLAAEAVFHKPAFDKPVPYGARSWLSANGIHALDALLFMMGGAPRDLTALTATAGASEPGIFSAVMRWPDGGQGVFLCNNSAGSRREEYVFHGPGETCRVTDEGLTVESHGRIVQTAFPALGDAVAAEHDCFLEAIRGGAQPRHSIAALAQSLFACELIETGFSGRVQLPRRERPASAPECSSAAKSVLVVQSAELQPALARLVPRFRVVTLEDVRGSTDQRPDIEAAVLGRGSPPLSPDILAKLPRLAVVGVVGLSVAAHDPERLLARGIALVNASEAYAESVAEFALGLAILGRRRAFTAHDTMRSGGWGPTPGLAGAVQRASRGLRPAIRALGLEKVSLRIWRTAKSAAGRPGTPALAGRELRGATVGLIGWSANARAFAARLVHAQARVLVYSEHATEGNVGSAGGTLASLGEVLAADIVSLHRGLTRSTLHFLGAPELSRLRPGAVLINIARGALIEPYALLARLRQGDIFACLDTYENEPLAASHPLRSLPNVFLTPHIAGGSTDTHSAAPLEVARKIADYLSGSHMDAISAERLRTMS